MVNDAAKRFGSCGAGLPASWAFSSKIGNDPGEQIKELLGIFFLNIRQLLGGSIANESGASGLEEPALGLVCAAVCA